MRKLKLIIGFIIALLFMSCSSDNISEENITGELKKWIVKELDPNNNLLFSTEYDISDNRINRIKYYDYDDTGIATKVSEEIFSYENGLLINQKQLYFISSVNDINIDFFYDESDQLIESLRHTIDTQFYAKNTYEYIGNSVSILKYRSIDDGVTFFLPNSNFGIELTFDDNNNLVSSRLPQTAVKTNINNANFSYDLGNNLIRAFKNPSTEINFSYTDKINPISTIYTNTYGKMGFYLIYSEDGLLFWRNISPNVLNSLSGREINSYFIDNTFVTGILVKMQINIDWFSDGKINSKIVSEFEYE